MVLKLLQQSDRRDSGPHDEHGHVVNAGAAQALLDAVEREPARSLEREIQRRAAQDHEAPELELPKEEADRAHDEQAQRHAAEECADLVAGRSHACGPVDAEQPAAGEPGQHDQRECLQVGVDRIDGRAERTIEGVAQPPRADPAEGDEHAVGRDVKAPDGLRISLRHVAWPPGRCSASCIGHGRARLEAQPDVQVP
jgi:hypothetical protein